ncbi:MAG TPA: hypothetical protein VFA94_02335 [Acidimicrobiales bacterium]|nr:hypothetical protein [Acidimicrobiales bacterium]
MTRAWERVWGRFGGRIGLLVLAAGYIVMTSALLQFLLARNMRRRMDFAISGGTIGVGLVVLGVVIVLVERAWLAADGEEQARRSFLAGLQTRAAAASGAGAALAAVPDLVVASANSCHRPDCLLVAGRDGVEELPLADALGRGLSACRLCLKGVGS